MMSFQRFVFSATFPEAYYFSTLTSECMFPVADEEIWFVKTCEFFCLVVCNCLWLVNIEALERLFYLM